MILIKKLIDLFIFACKNSSILYFSIICSLVIYAFYIFGSISIIKYRMIKSKTLSNFKTNDLFAKIANGAKKPVLRHRKVTKKRMHELKLLTMISIIKVYKKEYIFRMNNQDLSKNNAIKADDQMTF